MKIVSDWYYPLPKGFWENCCVNDPLESPPLRALERLSGAHECHAFTASTEEQCDRVINGVAYHTRSSWTEWLPEIAAMQPDVILSSGFLSVSYEVAKAAPKAKTAVFLHSDPASMFLTCGCDDRWKIFSALITPLDYGVRVIKRLLPDMRVEVIPCAANTALCRKYHKPMLEKRLIACGTGWHERKGASYSNKVFDSVRNDFNRPCGVLLWGLPKLQFFEAMADCKLLFFPSYGEGTARAVTEAAAVGTMPVVPLESASNCEHVRKLGGVAVPMGMYLSPTHNEQFAVDFTVPPREMAEKLIRLADSLTEYTPDVAWFDAENEIKLLVQLAETL